jgi:hypothetical protein
MSLELEAGLIMAVRDYELEERTRWDEGVDSDGNYSSKIRLISNNASFHFERGWTTFLKRDLMHLLAISDSLNDQNKAD